MSSPIAFVSCSEKKAWLPVNPNNELSVASAHWLRSASVNREEAGPTS